ncbi:MAG: glycosyltransferase family 2 protein [Woeseiaceae bacterium]
MIEHISIVIITKNVEETLAKTLDSVTEFSNVVLWDNGSEDASLQIAANYPNVDVHQGEFIGFGPSKNLACSLAKNAWVFSLDADESLSPELVTSLRSWPTDNEQAVGEVLRENHFMGRAVRHGGWGNDRLIRLFHFGQHQFDDAKVHEKVALSEQSQTHALAGHIEHQAARSLGEFLQKVDRYSEIRRQSRQKTYPAGIIFLKAFFAFFRSFVLKRGFLAGWRGLVIAWSNANGVFFKYMKVLADQKTARDARHRD